MPENNVGFGIWKKQGFGAVEILRKVPESTTAKKEWFLNKYYFMKLLNSSKNGYSWSILGLEVIFIFGLIDWINSLALL